ncbi:hypothetical protein [Streptomyces sp. H51]|uniref:hypothetical protein n=1 Tax=Streptomyces sp. H51 TaxID=3111770 RepID=UPI002D79496A|nr:hypothetical protein [Streptomyces sp. H51]
MPNTRVPSLDGLAAPRSGAAGPVLVPGGPGPGADTAGRRPPVRHRPGAVVGAVCARDAVGTVRWAEAPVLPVTVRRTGQGPVESHGGPLVTTGRTRPAGLAPAVAAYAA